MKTEIKKELADLRNRYEGIIHSSIDGIFIKDLSGRYLLINASAARAVGKKIKDFIGKTDFRIFPQKTAEEIARMDRKVIRAKKTFKFEERLALKNRIVYMETIKYPISDERGRPVFLCGIVRDITEWKKSEEALAERLRELSSLYQVSKDIDRIADIDELFKDVASISCRAMKGPGAFFIIWALDQNGARLIKAFRGAVSLKEAKRYLQRDGNFTTSLKIDGKKIGGFAAGYKDRKGRITREEKEFIRETSDLVSKELERRKIKEDLDRMFIEVVKSFSSALDARDKYTVDHSKRISSSARLIAERLNLNDEEKENLILGALLHDIGKIGISDSILGKPSRLTPEEFDKVKQHPLISERILKPIDALKGSLRIIRHHHERYDGLGYPDGLRGRRIPLGARILAVCDSYDAMVSERPYRSAMSIQMALEELMNQSGAQFDPQIAGIMIDLVGKGIFQ